MSKTPIVLCADDFGLSPAVSRGIVTLAAKGRLSATSCMTCSDNFSGDATELKSLFGQIDVGLHFSLTTLDPLSAVPTLRKNGGALSFGQVLRMSLTGRLPASDIRDELNRQLDVFEEVFGEAPHFLDGHHHVHQLPGVREVVVDVLRHRFPDRKPWLRVCRESLANIVSRRTAMAKTMFIGGFGYGLARLAAQAGIPVNSGFSGIYDFSGTVSFAELMGRFLDGGSAGALIMCHPGFVDDVLRSRDDVSSQREAELEYLMSDRFAHLLDEKNVCLRRLYQCFDPVA